MNIKTNKIIVSPVKKYAPPKYPTRFQATNSPELLRKLPSRWEKNAAVVAAVGMLGAISLTSCGIFEYRTDGVPATAPISSEQNITCETNDETMEYLAGDVIMEIPSEQDYTEPEETTAEESFLNTSYIMPAPGGIGPPSYISEADFITIINEMAETNGLNFEELPPNLEDAPPFIIGTTKKLYDAEKQVGVEYSYFGYSSREPYISSEGIAVGSFDISGYVDEIDEIWHEFYNKIEKIPFDENSEEYQLEWDKCYAEYETNMQAVLKKDLREQVRDFIEWLQGQGII